MDNMDRYEQLLRQLSKSSKRKFLAHCRWLKFVEIVLTARDWLADLPARYVYMVLGMEFPQEGSAA